MFKNAKCFPDKNLPFIFIRALSCCLLILNWMSVNFTPPTLKGWENAIFLSASSFSVIFSVLTCEVKSFLFVLFKRSNKIERNIFVSLASKFVVRCLRIFLGSCQFLYFYFLLFRNFFQDMHIFLSKIHLATSPAQTSESAPPVTSNHHTPNLKPLRPNKNLMKSEESRFLLLLSFLRPFLQAGFLLGCERNYLVDGYCVWQTCNLSSNT